MNKILFITFSFIFLGCNYPESSNYKRYKEIDFSDDKQSLSNEVSDQYRVVGIKDGDTFVVLIDGKEQIIRLKHINCPEKKKPFEN